MDTVKKSMLYTKRGDKGMTSLYDGTRVPKNDKVFYILGEIDQLNVYLGSAYYSCKMEFQENNPETLQELENKLRLLEFCIHTFMDVSSELATPNPEKRKRITCLEESDLEIIEKMTDYFDSKSPKLTNFVFPIGPRSTTDFHSARTQTRLIERMIKEYADEHDSEEDPRRVRDLIKKYFNRFSDFCFSLARYQLNYANRNGNGTEGEKIRGKDKPKVELNWTKKE